MLRKKELQKINYIQSPSNKRPLIKIISKTMSKLYKKYNYKQCNYTSIIIDNLIFNNNTHFVSVFKDHMIFDYKDEFLKREYSKRESLERVPKFAIFYKNYLQFFCKPLFKDFYLNEQIQDHGRNQAELFYNQNFKGKFEEEEDKLNQDLELYEENDEGSKVLIGRTIFNTSVKDNIDNHPFITNNNSLSRIKKQLIDKDNREETETSITFTHETAINDTGLLTPYSNEQSIISIMRHLKKRSHREPKAAQSNKNKNRNNNNNNNSNYNNNNINQMQLLSPKNDIKSKANIISYTRLCNEHLIKSNALKYIQKHNTNSQIHIKEISKTRSRNLSNKIEFKTYNPNNKKSLIKTQNIENLINRISQQVNSYLHSKNVYSIDQSNSSKKNIPIITYKAKSLCNLTKNVREYSNKTLYPSNKIDSSHQHHHKIHSTNDLKHSLNNNNDLMKLTLAFLMDSNTNINNNSSIKNIKTSYSNSKFPVSSKLIQNVNININNQININNNVHPHNTFSPKQIPSRLLNNQKVEVNIQSNLKKLLHKGKTGLSRNKESDMLTGNKNGVNCLNNDNATFQNSLWSNTINNSSKNKNMILTSNGNFNTLKKRQLSRNYNNNNGGTMQNNNLTKTLTKTITIPKSNVKSSLNKIVQGVNHHHHHPSMKYTQAISSNKFTKK